MTLKKEIIYFLRNQDIMTIAERGVTTDSTNDTLSSDIEYLIDIPNMKNIRSLEIDSTPLTYLKDYSYDLNFDDSGTIKTKITFTVAQTGALDVSYDYGTDKIFPDFPRDDLTINSYPRIAVDILSKTTDAFGVGGDLFINDTVLTIVIYSESHTYIQNKIDAIDLAFRQNAKNFYSAPFVKPIGRGAIIKSENRHQTLLQCNVDVNAIIEVN